MNKENQNMTDKKKDRPFVFVRCLTYNHEKYIEDALNGFVMQKTEFPFVVVIVNDASPDNTKFIIQQFISAVCKSEDVINNRTEYADIIQATPTENPNCLLYVLNLFENHFQRKSHRPYYKHFADKAIYWAECEGDDYWTDPYKLQKQVDYLESHPDYSMCFHGATIMNETNTKVITTCDKVETKEYFTNDIFPGWVVPTASVVYRREPIESYPPLKHQEWMKYGDIVLFLKCTHTGRVWGMADQMSVYRMTNSGTVVSQNKQGDSAYFVSMCKHYEFLMLNFPKLDHSWPNNYIATYYYSVMRHPKSFHDVFVGLYNVLKSNPRILFQHVCKR